MTNPYINDDAGELDRINPYIENHLVPQAVYSQNENDSYLNANSNSGNENDSNIRYPASPNDDKVDEKSNPDDDKVEKKEPAFQTLINEDTTPDNSQIHQVTVLFGCIKVESMWRFILGSIFIIFFFFVSIISFSIGCAALSKAKKSNPQNTYSTPDASVIALHWVFHVSMIILGIVLIFAALGHRSIPLSVFIIIVCVAFYIAYTAVSFTREEYEIVGNVMDFAAYEEYKQKIKQAMPYVSYTARGTIYNSSYDSVGHCYLSPISYKSVESNDSTTFVDVNPEAQFFYQILFDVSVGWDSASISFMNKAGDLIYLRLWRKSPYCREYNNIVWIGVDRNYRIPGLLDGIFLSSSGKLPDSISKAKRTSLGLFFMGVYYCYKVDSIANKYYTTVSKSAKLGKYDDPSYSLITAHQSCSGSC